MCIRDREFASISATTAEGDPVELTEVEAGKVYTFTMPASKHDVYKRQVCDIGEARGNPGDFL